MGILSLKTKIAVMWVSFSVVNLLVNLMIKLLDVSLPAYFQSMQSTATAEMVFWVLVPLLMAVLTLCLKDAGSRWTNIIVGIIFLIFNVGWTIVLIMSKSAPTIIGALAGVALLVLITVYSLRWPKNK